jgi:hypothetical protein
MQLCGVSNMAVILPEHTFVLRATTAGIPLSRKPYWSSNVRPLLLSLRSRSPVPIAGVSLGCIPFVGVQPPDNSHSAWEVHYLRRSPPATRLEHVRAHVPLVHEATLVGGKLADPAALGGAVTEALCGRCDHEGSCRWPHNNAAASDAGSVRIRTVFMAHECDEAEIRGRIDSALRNVEGWTLVSSGPAALRASEQTRAERLAGTPPPPAG